MMRTDVRQKDKRREGYKDEEPVKACVLNEGRAFIVDGEDRQQEVG
jgi:hypothetical protein